MAEIGRRQDLYLKKKKKKSPFLSILLHYVLTYLVINSCILFFVMATPKVQVNDPTEHSDDASLSVLVHVDSVLPIKSFVAKLEGEELNFTKENENYVYVSTGENGRITEPITKEAVYTLAQYDEVFLHPEKLKEDEILE